MMREIRSRSYRWKTVAIIPAVIAMAGVLTAPSAPASDPEKTLSFVIGNLYLANGGDQDQCPVLADGGVEIFFRSLPVEEKQQFAAADNPERIASEKRPALEKLMATRLGLRTLWIAKAQKLPAGYQAGALPDAKQADELARLNGFPSGRGKIAFGNRRVDYSTCTHPDDFPALAKPFRTYEGKVAAGIDLDGKTGKDDFTGADGRTGVDNQLWRVSGCVKALRDSSDPQSARRTLMSALSPTLVTIEGVDSLIDDPEVTVRVRSGIDPTTRDGRGQLLARATFTADPDPRFQATGRGRIENGVLVTEPFDVMMSYKEQIIDSPRDIRSARIRAKLNKDGTIDGSLYGYQTVESVYGTVEQMTQAGANANGLSCPAMRQALVRYADGVPDPRTRKPTALSAAYNFYGTRAFVVTRDEEGTAR